METSWPAYKIASARLQPDVCFMKALIDLWRYLQIWFVSRGRRGRWKRTRGASSAGCYRTEARLPLWDSRRGVEENFPESIQTALCIQAAGERWWQERTCKHSSSVRTPQAALVSVPRPCRGFISGRTFDAWRRSTRLNSPRTADIPQTLRLMNYVCSITIERAEFLSRGTYNWYSGYRRHSRACIMQACTSVTVVASEIPHRAPKTCWLQSWFPVARRRQHFRARSGRNLWISNHPGTQTSTAKSIFTLSLFKTGRRGAWFQSLRCWVLGPGLVLSTATVSFSRHKLSSKTIWRSVNKERIMSRGTVLISCSGGQEVNMQEYRLKAIFSLRFGSWWWT